MTKTAGSAHDLITRGRQKKAGRRDFGSNTRLRAVLRDLLTTHTILRSDLEAFLAARTHMKVVIH
jgi:hypothetical protein